MSERGTPGRAVRKVGQNEFAGLKRRGPAEHRCVSAFEALREFGGRAVRVAGGGVVQFDTVDLQTDGDRIWLDIYLSSASGGDPHYRIFNPPTLIRDPRGDVQRGPDRYRIDPVAAVALVIAEHGGKAVRRR